MNSSNVIFISEIFSEGSLNSIFRVSNSIPKKVKIWTGSTVRGFGIYFQGRWAQANWPNEWAENGTLADITFLELFPVVVAISIWGWRFLVFCTRT
jgi:hypothetical protein